MFALSIDIFSILYLAYWIEGPWSKCSLECGGGLKTRIVICSTGQNEVCSADEKPNNTDTCNLHACTENSLANAGRRAISDSNRFSWHLFF